MNRWMFSTLATLIFLQTLGISTATGLDVSPKFAISSGLSGDISRPGVAYDGNNYMVAWCQQDEVSTKIIGALVSPESTSTKTFTIAELSPINGCNANRPTVAFDGKNYLIVFSGVGARVTPSGTRLDSLTGFTILPNNTWPPDVAFDGTNYLVVGTGFADETQHGVIGAWVSPDGQVSGKIPINTATGDPIEPAVAFDGQNYLVLWFDQLAGDIFGTRVTPTGAVLDPKAIPISTAFDAQFAPSLVYDGTNYFAAWKDWRNTSVNFRAGFIVGTRITPEGVLLDGPPDNGGIVIATNPGYEYPVVSFNGMDYMVTWVMRFGENYNSFTRISSSRVSTEGTLVDGPPSVPSNLISGDCDYCPTLSSPNAAHGDGGTLVVWVEEYPYSNFEQKLVVGAFVTPQPEVQDWWWNPAMDGMGWTVGKQGNSVVVSWYHYWTTTGPTFLLFHGPLVNNVVQGTLWRSYATPPPPPNYDPALLSNEAVGSARLSFLSDSQAIFEYSYDDRSGSITLQRFNFDDINLSGSWRYFASGIQSECKFPVNDGPYVANGDLTISQVGKTITIAQAFDAGGTCTYRLNATQNGSYTDAEGSYACSFGVSGLAEFRDMHIVDDILTLRYASEVSSGEACEHKSKLIGFQ